MIEKTEEGYLFEQFKYCECGCGFTLPKLDKWGKEKYYIYTHWSRSHHPTNYRGWRKTSSGYIKIFMPEHRLADSSGCVLEHRLVWEEYHKACLLPWSEVHHINGIKTDNRIENLEGMSKSQHITLHNRKDMTGRYCLICNSNTTSWYEGNFNWYRYNGGFICSKDYLAMYRTKIKKHK